MQTNIQVKKPKSMAFILMLGAFIGLFGETALNMALSNVMDDFSIIAATAQWLTIGYLLILAILVPISALLMKWFTTRQLVVGGLVISMLGAVLAAASPNFSILLVGRLIQAIGTGILLPVMMNVLLLIFSINKRGVVMGIMALNQLPRELYADGSAAMNTLNQVAGAAGTAIAITLFTAGQNGYLTDYPDASQQKILAAGVKYTFPFITGISAIELLCSFFVKKRAS